MRLFSACPRVPGDDSPGYIFVPRAAIPRSIFGPRAQPWVQQKTSGLAALGPFLDLGQPALGPFLDQGLASLSTTSDFRAGSPEYNK